jgi:GntR family transcriptional repressor for pyruvate dehydrogenase complex
MKLRTIPRVSLVETVVQQLRESIERGHLAGGDRLPTESELISQLGVSRTVLREAMTQLQAVGLVTIRRGVGTYVAEHDNLAKCARLARTAMALSSDELIRFLELREAIESHAARLAARLAMESIDQDEEAMCIDLQFHLRLVELTGNRLMLSILNVLQEFIMEGMLRTTPRPRQRMVSKRYHMAIIDAIRNHNPDAAEAALRDHMDLLIRRLQEGGKQNREES